jgi:protein TonB
MIALWSLTMTLMFASPETMPTQILEDPVMPVANDNATMQEEHKKKAAAELEEIDEPPAPTKTVSPAYPESAKKDTLEGVVYLRVLISEGGAVKEVHVEKGVREDLNKAAVDAMKQWLFKPPTKKGKPVQTTVVVPFKFKLAK